MKVTRADIPEILIIESDVHEDPRGFFMETYHQRRYSEAGIGRAFVQDNFVRSQGNIVRGLHYQLKHPQGKLIHVTRGRIFDAAVDIRWGSSTFGRWVGLELSQENRRQIFVPPGFAQGYSVISDQADVVYKCTDFYAPEDEYGILWADPDIGIDWPIQKPLLSPKDRHYPRLCRVPKELLPSCHSG
jgi:dTDP-4-dehydrorhamnose 3,5-epimerase